MEHFIQTVVQREISTFLLYVLIAAVLCYGSTKLLERYENDSRMHREAHFSVVTHLNHLGGIVRDNKWSVQNSLNHLDDLARSNQRDIGDLNYDLEDIRDNDESSTTSSVSTDSKVEVDGEPV